MYDGLGRQVLALFCSANFTVTKKRFFKVYFLCVKSFIDVSDIFNVNKYTKYMHFCNICFLTHFWISCLSGCVYLTAQPRKFWNKIFAKLMHGSVSVPGNDQKSQKSELSHKWLR